jgi:hypothetical protein
VAPKKKTTLNTSMSHMCSIAVLIKDVKKKANITPKYRQKTVPGKVRSAKPRDLRTLSHQVLTRLVEVCNSNVEGAPRASAGGATTIKSRCCSTCAWKYDAVKVATGDCTARSILKRPSMKAAVRRAGQRRPRPARRQSARRYQ